MMMFNFNSIKVRLERKSNKNRLKRKFHFNSIKVRLEQEKAYYIEEEDWDFNSIKVRLEPIKVFYGLGRSKFQFHKGTIRTHQRTTGENRPI